MRLARPIITCLIASALLGRLAAAAQDQLELPHRWDVVVFHSVEGTGLSRIKRLNNVPESLPRWDIKVFKRPAQSENSYIKRLDRLPSGR